MLDRAIRAHSPKGSPAYFHYFELISVVRSRSTILAPQNINSNGGLRSLRELLLAIVRVSRYWDSWLKPPIAWSADKTKSVYVQFRSLVNHLFAKYEVPYFMTSTWFADAEDHIQLFIELGLGKSVRKCKTFIPLSKKMARLFMCAPNDLTLTQAIRWSQVCSYGGDEKFARDVLRTRLTDPQDDELFWDEFLRFLVANRIKQDASKHVSSVSIEELQQLVEYCHQHKFERASQVLGYQVVNDQPLQPNFSVKRRTIKWLHQRMANWETEIELPARNKHFTGIFPNAQINSFNFSQGDVTWTIDQITDTEMLKVEGGIMQHCVGSYAKVCRKGKTSIWSLKEQSQNKRRRLVTIEVWPSSRVIVQVQGKRNSAPTTAARRMVSIWAEREGLTWR